MRQLKIDIDQNRLQSIEKIHKLSYLTLLHLTFLNVKYIVFNLVRVPPLYLTGQGRVQNCTKYFRF
jgi:hypothetical protein